MNVGDAAEGVKRCVDGERVVQWVVASTLTVRGETKGKTTNDKRQTAPVKLTYLDLLSR